MHSAVVTDELSDELETALELAADMGLRHVELPGSAGIERPVWVRSWNSASRNC